MTQSQQVQNCIKSINVTWVLITVWHFIVVVDKNMKSLESVVALGIAVHIGFQSMVNVGVCLNLIPNTGIELIFISYGGTALITQMAEIGMVTAISKRNCCIASAKRQLKKVNKIYFIVDEK